MTRGADGMTLFEAGAGPVHIPVASKSEGFDVTGDTVDAAFPLRASRAPTSPRCGVPRHVTGGMSVRRFPCRDKGVARRAGRVG